MDMAATCPRRSVMQGFIDEIKNYPDIEVVAVEYANCEISRGWK